MLDDLLPVPVYYALQLAGLVLGALWWRYVDRDKRLEELCLVGIAGDALLTALIRYQDTGLVAWWVAAMLTVAVAAPWLRNLQGKVGVMADRKERRALAQLFGEPTLADMFFRDPRLEALRRKRCAPRH